MADAMATARMPQEKKESAGKVFDSLGITASGAINQFYDYVIRNKELPFGQAQKHEYTQEEIVQAYSFVQGLVVPLSDKYKNMSIKDAKRERLAKQGFADERANAR